MIFLRLNLISNPFGSRSFIILDLLNATYSTFDKNIVPPFLVFNIFEPTFSVFFCTLSNMSTCFIMTCV